MWDEQTIGILERCRRNCVLLSKLHRKEYIYYKGFLKYFKLPVICLSAINSVASVGISGYLPQSYISQLTCGISLICGIISSIELYLGISKSLENSDNISKSFYLLSVDIFKELSLAVENRSDPKTFLEQTLGEYCKLIEQSSISKKKISDQLQPITVADVNVELSSVSSGSNTPH